MELANWITCKWQNHRYVSKTEYVSQVVYQTITWNNKNELWKTVRLTSFQKAPLQYGLVSILFKIVHPFLLLYLLWFLCSLIFMFWAVRVIFVWPEKRNNKLKETERFDWFCRTNTNARGFWLVTRTLGWKNFMDEELSRNQLTLRFDVLVQHDWPIEQCLPHIKVSFGGKPKSPCFDLFIHWLTKQKTNTYRNHFSRSYENRSISVSPSLVAVHTV